MVIIVIVVGYNKIMLTLYYNIRIYLIYYIIISKQFQKYPKIILFSIKKKMIKSLNCG